MNDAVLAAASALGADVVTSTASLDVVAHQERKRDRTAEHSESASVLDLFN